MRMGVCGAISNITKAEAVGFDYYESTVVPVSKMTEEEYREIKKAVEASSLKIEAFNSTFPGDMPLTGPEADLARAKEYIKTVFPLLKALGAEIVVFGSGKSRRIPDGFSREKAWEQLIALCRMLGEEAQANGIVMTLEPLNTRESNVINSVSEGGRLVKDTGHPSFMLLADYYHMGLENETFDGILEYARYMRHTHIANPAGRINPQPGDGADYDGFFAALARAGYKGRISYEGKITDFDKEMSESLQYLKTLAAKHGL